MLLKMCSVKKCLTETVICLCLLVIHIKNAHGSSVNNSLVHLRIPRQLNRNNGCLLPQHPKLGQWSVYQSTSQPHPGMLVPFSTILQISCRDNYKLDGDATIVCINGEWSAEVGQCLKTCPPIHSTRTMLVTCTYNNRAKENCTNAVDGTVAEFKCADFYEDQGLERQPFRLCYNGKWSQNIPECVPVCGQKSVKNNPTLIVNGSIVTKGEYPWQVAIYNKTDKLLICGGSLINQRVILTAAHCITDEKGKMLPKEFYVVAVGKYYRDYDDPRDNEVQFSPIHEMFIPRQYKGDIQNYFGDIAILITKKTFFLSTRVLPVCVDWAAKYQKTLLDPTKQQYAYVTGWGYTIEHKKPSDVLKELKVPLVTETQCTEEVPEDYEKFLTDDKLCAGYLNSGTSVCKGDSGGGLVFKYGNRFYVAAVVSLSPQAPTEEGGCDSQQYALYTKVYDYIESLILEKEAKFRPSNFENVDCDQDPNCKEETTTPPPIPSTTTEEPVTETPKGGCILPEHPLSGQWSIFGLGSGLKPGAIVSTGTILQISCNKGLKLDGSEVILCQNGKWASKVGQCSQICPAIHSTPTTEITCTFKDKIIDCRNPVHGTIAKHTCAPFYEDLQLVKNPVRVCRNGTWDLSKPECVPACGQKSVTAKTLIVNGKNANKGDYPWHVGIYYGKDKRFICSGSLISQKVILTAAHCITNVDGKLRSTNDYTVAVGKLYRDFYDPLDSDAQTSKLQDMFIPLQFGGVKQNLLGDIAILVTQMTFTLSRKVQPVCVDWGKKFGNLLNSEPKLEGYVSGWGFIVPNAGTPADILQDLKVPLVPNKICLASVPEEFQPFVTYDKLCAGYLNKSASTCNGDAGGALVVKHEGRYYVTGIISAAPSTSAGGCDIQQYSLYTNVAHYLDFILEKEAQFKSFSPSNTDCNSNEDSCRTTSTIKPPQEPAAPKTSCNLPQHPNFGSWSIYGFTSTKLSPGTPVELGTVLQISCQNNYKLDGDSVILCEKGKWTSNVGKCLRMCPSVYSTPILKATCIFNGKESENCTDPTDGTRIKYECAPYYEDMQLAQNPIHVCQDGSWDHKRPQCVPACGQKSVRAQTLIINGQITKRGDYPWHIALYRGNEKQFICSGTLITPRVILTGALCVTDVDGKPRSKDQFSVAAGKYYQKYNDPRETSKELQFMTLEDMFVQQHYRGEAQLYANAIAILVTKEPFTLSQSVQPVCVDWGLKYQTEISNPQNLTGYITGWGYTTENAQISDELRELKVPLISYEKCLDELPKDFVKYLTYDKLCAGYLNKSSSVCRGDSGGGLVVKFNSRYYISGILVVGPQGPQGGCNSQQYALYTKISTHMDFILPKATQFPS